MILYLYNNAIDYHQQSSLFQSSLIIPECTTIHVVGVCLNKSFSKKQILTRILQSLVLFQIYDDDDVRYL